MSVRTGPYQMTNKHIYIRDTTAMLPHHISDLKQCIWRLDEISSLVMYRHDNLGTYVRSTDCIICSMCTIARSPLISDLYRTYKAVT